MTSPGAFDASRPGQHLPQGETPHVRKDSPIVVGLVNNMPDAALRTTEQQFRSLLSAASQGHAVHLRLFSLPGIPRAEAGQAHVSQHYEGLDALCAARLDGLIVTGTEPRAPKLTGEPYWPALTRLVDWAEDRAVPAIWSCLAAHAAVLHLDGIERRALQEKLSGVFDCAKTGEFAVLAGIQSRWHVPHSRHNELPEEALTAKGYCILSRSPEAGVDIFAKRDGIRSLFLQGHPEYGPEALLTEYRRNVRRFLAGGQEDYPGMPHGYFDTGAEAVLAAFRERALRARNPSLLLDFPAETAARTLAHSWREPAVRLYTAWLSYLVEQRSGVSRPVRAPRDLAAVL